MPDTEFDVFLQGTVFYDVVLTGLPSPPREQATAW